MSSALVPIGQIRDDEDPQNRLQGWLNDEVDARNAEEQRENFSSTFLATPGSDEDEDDNEKVTVTGPFKQTTTIATDAKDNADERTHIFMRADTTAEGEKGAEDKHWAIPNDVLRNRSNLFSLMFRGGAKNSSNNQITTATCSEKSLGVSEQTSPVAFREAVTKTVMFEHDRATAFILTWIERDGQVPIEDIILGKNGCAEDFVPVMRAAHYFGADEALSSLEQTLINDNGVIDVDNCLSLLCLAEELDLHKLKVTCTDFAFRKIDEIKSSPFWRDEICIFMKSLRMGGSETGASPSSASEEVGTHFATICSLRNAALRHGLTGTEFPDAREYLAMLRESLAMQEERFAESVALTDYDEKMSGRPKNRARVLLTEQRQNIEKFREFIALQDSLFQIELKRHGSVKDISTPKFELGHALLHVD